MGAKKDPRGVLRSGGGLANDSACAEGDVGADDAVGLCAGEVVGCIIKEDVSGTCLKDGAFGAACGCDEGIWFDFPSVEGGPDLLHGFGSACGDEGYFEVFARGVCDC